MLIAFILWVNCPRNLLLTTAQGLQLFASCAHSHTRTSSAIYQGNRFTTIAIVAKETSVKGQTMTVMAETYAV